MMTLISYPISYTTQEAFILKLDVICRLTYFGSVKIKSAPLLVPLQW
jgi:hypothetical protein